MEQPRSKGPSVLGQAVSWGCGLMWPVVTQLPSKALGLWVYLWGVYLHVLSLGLETTLLCLLELLRALCLSVLRAGRAVLMAVSSVAHVAQACSVYILLQGLSWSAQLAGSWVALLLWLFHALLEMLRRIPLIPIFDQVARWMVRTGVQASRALAQVRGMGTLVQLCAHVFFLGLYLCMHICLSAISSQVRVRVQVPFRLSLPVRIHIPLSLGIKVRLKQGKKGNAEGEAGTSQGEARKEQKPCTPRRLEPTRREVSSSRSESSSVVPSAATLIIVVCVGFLVLMVILGLVRIHSLHRRVSGADGPLGTTSDPKDPDLFWDDSALTIIVNPMESYQSRQARVAGPAGAQPEDEDSSDSEAADSPSSDERRIIEGPPHRY